MVEITLACAEAIQPMVQYLYRNGVISIHGNDNEIHCTRELFFSTFKDFKTKEDTTDSPYTEVFHEDPDTGIHWFCLIPKEAKE